MSKKIRFAQSIIVSLMILLTANACRRQDLEYEFAEAARIPIFVDWTKADIVPQNVTVLIYDQATGKLFKEHRFANNTNDIQSYVDVPVGKYTVVVFNELRDQIDYVRISGHEDLSTLRAYVTQNNSPLVRADNVYYVNEPGILASKVISNFEVTADMVANNLYYSKSKSKSKSIAIKSDDPINALMGIVPERKVGLCNVNIHIDGLINSRLPVLIDLQSMAGEYNFQNDLNEKVATHQASLSNTTFDAKSSKNGTISGSFYSFGVMGNRETIADQPKANPLTMVVRFMLVDQAKTVHTYTFDVSDVITFSKETNTSITVNINKNISEVLPDVVPEGSKGGSGFETKLIDWGVVNVPLISQ